MMDVFNFKYLTFAFFPLFLFYFVRAVYDLWWKPKRLEKYLRQKGIHGLSYKETKKMIKAQENFKLKPLKLNHAIAQYVQPFDHYLVQKYGRISLCWVANVPRLIVTDAEVVKQILDDKNGHFRKKHTNPQAGLLTPGIASLDGEEWSKRKKYISPAFHHDKIMGTVEEFLACSYNLIERWRKKVNVNSQGGKFALDISPEMHYLTSEVIARAAFGTTYEEAKTIFELQYQQQVFVYEAYEKPHFPGSRFLPTAKNMKAYMLNSKIDAILNDMILRKQRKLEAGNPDDDLLTLLLKCRGQNDMTFDDVLQECKFFYFAGQDTTASWLTWTMIVLAMHPEWQEKARKEVLQVFGKRTPDVKSINQLKILTMVLNEVLRLYPPVTTIPRYTSKNTQVGDMVIPAGVQFFLDVLLIHHDPEYWGEGVNEFKPERFAQGISKAAKEDQTAFYPFGWGPRLCLGQNFATLEAKLAMSMILQHFSFELSPSYTHAPHCLVILEPKHGAELILQQI